MSLPCPYIDILPGRNFHSPAPLHNELAQYSLHVADLSIHSRSKWILPQYAQQPACLLMAHPKPARARNRLHAQAVTRGHCPFIHQGARYRQHQVSGLCMTLLCMYQTWYLRRYRAFQPLEGALGMISPTQNARPVRSHLGARPKRQMAARQVNPDRVVKPPQPHSKLEPNGEWPHVGGDDSTWLHHGQSWP